MYSNKHPQQKHPQEIIRDFLTKSKTTSFHGSLPFFSHTTKALLLQKCENPRKIPCFASGRNSRIRPYLGFFEFLLNAFRCLDTFFARILSTLRFPLLFIVIDAKGATVELCFGKFLT